MGPFGPDPVPFLLPRRTSKVWPSVVFPMYTTRRRECLVSETFSEVSPKYDGDGDPSGRSRGDGSPVERN